jgi:B12 binding domain/Radical SAM superfamily
LRIALVNTNRYLQPPVIPLGIEYIAHYTEREGHELKVIDLTFAEKPEERMRQELASFDPQVVGFSIRNNDSGLHPGTIFFLDEAAALISQARDSCEAKIIVGGSALMVGPSEVAAYLDCDCAVWGPGEKALPLLLAGLKNDGSLPQLFNGWATGFDPHEVPARGRWIDYDDYLKDRGVAGFEIQVGCRSGCPFCIEARLPWKARGIEAVIRELGALLEAGCTEMHLCDCEFNQDLEFSKALLRRVSAEGMAFDWSLYMKPVPCDSELLRLIARSGSRSITVSVDSPSLAAGAYRLDAVGYFIREAKAEGIKVFVDLLIGFPGEELGELQAITEFFKRERPESVGLNSWIRLYKHTELGRSIMARPPGRGRIEGSDPDCLQPVFYNWLDEKKCDSLIDGDPVFRVEGRERLSNYERA